MAVCGNSLVVGSQAVYFNCKLCFVKRFLYFYIFYFLILQQFLRNIGPIICRMKEFLVVSQCGKDVLGLVRVFRASAMFM
jgi:hypothetical protein